MRAMPPSSTSFIAIPLSPLLILSRHVLPTLKHTQKRSFGIKSLDGPRHDRFHPKNLLASQRAAVKRIEDANTLPLRTGAMAIKMGMTAVYDDEGKRVPVTVLQLDRQPGCDAQDEATERILRGLRRQWMEGREECNKADVGPLLESGRESEDASARVSSEGYFGAVADRGID